MPLEIARGRSGTDLPPCTGLALLDLRHDELSHNVGIELRMYGDRHICIIVPAHNEQSSIGKVLESLYSLTGPDGSDPLVDRVIVCDNASTDETGIIASRYPCRIVHHPIPGYGAACHAALSDPGEKDIVVFVDADCSVVVSEMPDLLAPIIQGADLVIGARVPSRREAGALSVPQRFGNRLASYLIRILWRYPVTDLGPFRAIRWDALQTIDMHDRKFGWTVEMQVRAIQEGMEVIEVPVSVKKRTGRSKISGTVSGVVGAGAGILGTIFKLYLREHVQWFARRTVSKKSAL